MSDNARNPMIVDFKDKTEAASELVIEVPTSTTKQTINAHNKLQRSKESASTKALATEKISNIVPSLHGTWEIFPEQLKVLSPNHLLEQQKAENSLPKSRTLSPELKAVPNIFKMSCIEDLSEARTVLATTTNVDQNSEQLNKSSNFDSESSTSIDVNNCRTWSEALAHAQTIHITDSVVLSVAKSVNGSNNSTNKTFACSTPTVTVKETFNQQKNIPISVSRNMSIITNSDTKPSVKINKTNKCKQTSWSQPHHAVLHENCEKIKQLSLLKSKQQIIRKPYTNLQPPPSHIPDEAKPNPTYLPKKNTNKERYLINSEIFNKSAALLQKCSNRERRSHSVNYPPVQNSKQLDMEFDNSEVQKLRKHKRRNSTSSMCNMMDLKVDINLLKREKIAFIDENNIQPSAKALRDIETTPLVFTKENDLTPQDLLPRSLSELSQVVLEKNCIAKETENCTRKTITTQKKIPSTLTKPAVVIIPINVDSDDEVSVNNSDDIITLTNRNAKQNSECLTISSSNSSMTDDTTKSIGNIGIKSSLQKKIKPKQKEDNLTQSDSNTTSNIPIKAEVTKFSSAVDILSTFNMLTWRERIGSARGTKLRFQLNEFNLLQVYERIKPRAAVPTVFERPIYERDDSQINKLRNGHTPIDPLLYLCRRCRCHGPANEFLAPGNFRSVFTKL